MHLSAPTNLFDQTVMLLLVAAVAGLLAARLKQPVLTGFIAVGVLIGPSGLGWTGQAGEFHLLAEIGLALLLFVVGLKLDVTLIRTMGAPVLIVGFSQIIVTALLGFGAALAVGMDVLPAVYTAVALTISSTIIIVKLLSDKRESDSLYGRIAVGVLILQDLVVVLVMILLPALAGGGTGDIGHQLLLMAAKGAALLAGLALVMTFVLPRLLIILSSPPELLVLSGIAWAVGLAALANYIGFSKEVGAFLAGVSLASSPVREMLAARLASLRDFLLLFFFVEMGSKLDTHSLGGQFWTALGLILFVLLVKPLVVMAAMRALHYGRRPAFMAGISVGQISEFSLILVAVGTKFGHISRETAAVLTLVGLVTIAVSSYLILYAQPIYAAIAKRLKPYAHAIHGAEQAADTKQSECEAVDIVLFGCGSYGTGMERALAADGRRVLGVDFDPEAVRAWNANGRRAWFGDAQDPEFPHLLPLGGAQWVVSALPARDANVALAHNLIEHGFEGNIALTAQRAEDTQELLRAGATVVFEPFANAATEAADMLVKTERQEVRRRMDETIDRMQGHYIICGFGRMGKQIAKDLRHNNLPFVVLEWNPEQIPSLAERGVMYVEGRATDDEALKRAGIDRAQGLIAVTATDEENVFIVLTARELNPKLFIVARSILEENEPKLRRAGANRVMSPYILGGRRMAAAVTKPSTMDFLDAVMHDDSAGMEFGDFVVSEQCRLVGKSLKESGVRQDLGITVLAVHREGEPMHTNPQADFVILPGDELIVMGDPDAISRADEVICGCAPEE